MTEKQIIDELKNDVACKENKIHYLAEHIINLQDQLKAKEQEIKKICKAFDIEYAIDEETGNLFGRCNKLYKKEQECERLKWYLKEIRDDELKTLDIEWDEYETHCIDTEYTNIINLVEEALEERSPEDCRYGK